MRAIMVMFDTLNRRMLPPYGAEGIVAPNFERLARRAVTFDTAYGGSMPCMPARRELHTGRHNFLHRSWGPLEPFDDSVIEMLGTSGVHTHLATDHQHYWEDGGATYHTRYSTFELFRGQEGDPWKGQVADPEIPDSAGMAAHLRPNVWRQDWVNRGYLEDESTHPQTLTFDAGVEFLRTNAGEDRWFVQIETFDPHEPFFSYPQHKRHYPTDYTGPHFDWPDYAKVTEDSAAVDHARAEYAALLTMCDASLGRVLDAMDDLDLWRDTLLIVNTDHGLMLGEHGWWGKNVQPWYDETIHLPLFVWHPALPNVAGSRRQDLVRTIDIGPTLLDWFGLTPTERMEGTSIIPVIEEAGATTTEYAIFGMFGGHACVTDGRYVYMRACADDRNTPLFEHTLMPTRMRGFFPDEELADAELVGPLSFTRGMKVLRTPTRSHVTPWLFGSQLFDLFSDPEQNTPLIDDALELSLATALRDCMLANDAPASQFERLKLPIAGRLNDSHLLVQAQWPQLQASTLPATRSADFGTDGALLDRPLRELLAQPGARALLQERAPSLTSGELSSVLQELSLIQIASIPLGLLPRPLLAELVTQLSGVVALPEP